ncbi:MULTISPECIES: hypothetical protein [Microcoleaceae]|uniref:hypothetical protein n=1 Tax=Microcoleaceae TaxID=1892252 RepID=UPI001D14B849|nr:hypothetical protein [Tychonema sp. LEGE 06208]
MRSPPTIAPNTGVCALVAAKQVGILRVGNGDEVNALSNYRLNCSITLRQNPIFLWVLAAFALRRDAGK